MIEPSEYRRRMRNLQYEEDLTKYSFQILQAILSNTDFVSKLEQMGIKVNSYCIDAAEAMLLKLNERFEEQNKPKKKK